MEARWRRYSRSPSPVCGLTEGGKNGGVAGWSEKGGLDVAFGGVCWW